MGLSLPQSTMSKSPNALEVYRGQSKDIEVVITTPSTDVDNNPITIAYDLTGCTLYFTVKIRSSTTKSLISKVSTDPSQIEIETPVKLGKAIIHLLPADTKYLEPDAYQFDVWVKTPSNSVYPVVAVSEFVLLQPITVVD